MAATSPPEEGAGLISPVSRGPKSAEGAPLAWTRLAAVAHQPTGRILFELLGLFVVLAAAWLFFRRPLANGWVFVDPDSFRQTYPAAVVIAQRLREGELPLWTPDIFSGFPLFAEGQIGALYPLNRWLLPALRLDQALVLLPVIRLALAGLGAYGYGRVLGLSLGAALVTGVVYSLGGYSLAAVPNWNVADAMVWLPPALALIDLGLRAHGPRRWLFLALAGGALGLMGLAGHGPSWELSTGLAIGYLIFRLVAGPVWPGTLWVSLRGRGQRSRDIARRVALAAGASLLLLVGAIGLSAAQILPLAGLAADARRPAPPAGISLAAGLFGLTLPEAWGGGSAAYVGLLPLALALVAVCGGRTRTAWFYGVVALLAAWAALGAQAPLNLFARLAALPGLGVPRQPADFGLWGGLALAVLAGLGVQALRLGLADSVPGEAGWRRWRAPARLFRLLGYGLVGLAILLPGLLLACRALLAANVPAGRDLVRAWISAAPDAYERLLIALRPDTGATLRAVILLLLVGALLIAWGRWESCGPLWLGLGLLLISGDLLLAGWRINPPLPVSALDTSSRLTDYLRENNGRYRAYTVPGLPGEPNRLLLTEIADANGASDLPPERHVAYAQAASATRNHLFDLWNVRYVVSAPGTPWVAAGGNVVERDGPASIVQNDTWLPRVWLAANAEQARSPEQALARLSAPEFDPRSSVLLEVPPPRPAQPAASAANPGSAVLEPEQPERVVVTVEANSPAYLFLADRYDPGWRAFVDGKEAPLLRADYLFRAVPVPAGRHQVALIYAPPDVALGAAFSAGTLVGLAVGSALWATWETIRRLRRPLWPIASGT